MALYVLFLTVFGYFVVEGKGISYFCGQNLRPYDTSIEECVGGQVFLKTTQTSITSTAESSLSSTAQNQLNESDSVPHANSESNRIPRRLCRDNADLLSCNGKIYCGRHEGYSCCGFETYHPNTQTCCQQTSAVYRIHDERPEKHNICCKLDVYERGSTNLSCVHASANDKFLQKPKRLNDLREDPKLCSYPLYVFRIDIGKIRKKRHDVKAVVRMWDLVPKLKLRKSGVLKKKMRIKFDKYSERSNLVKANKRFLLLSDYDFLNDSFLYLRANDVLYKCPRKYSKMVRLLRTLFDKCGN